MSTREVGGRARGYRRTGAGPPLVLLNGFAATKDDWDPAFLDALAADHELVLLDHRGMGESADGGGPFTVEDLADDAADAIDALELDRAAVLGWSMGGYVALSLARRHPERVERLVLLSTTGGGELAMPGEEAIRGELRDTSGTPREQARRLISLLFPPARAAAVDAQFGDVVARARAALSADVTERQWAAMEAWERRPSAREDVGRISCPALAATGDEDVVIPPENSLELSKAIPGAWLARFAGSGHGFIADHPLELARLIAIFGRVT